MKPACIRIAVVFVLLALPASGAFSAWDDTQLRLLQQYPPALRWDNIEGPPHWVSGSKPQRQFARRLHLFCLHPGQEVILRANSGACLRLTGEKKTLTGDDLIISIATDARAFVETAATQTIDPYSLLVALPQDAPTLVRLARPFQSDSNLVFAAYVSREEPSPAFAPFRESVPLPGKAVRMRREDQAVSESAPLLGPGESLDLPVNGPVRLQLRVQLRWPRTELLREQLVLLEAQVDQTPPFTLLLSPEVNARHRTRVDHTVTLVSHPMTGFVTVPEGKHSLRLQSFAPIFLSVFRQPAQDFLFSRLNGPSTDLPWDLQFSTSPAGLSAKHPGPQRVLENLSALTSEDLIVQQEQEAWALGLDNNVLDAGAQAADWVNRLSRSRRDYPAVRETAETLWRQRTTYREILPAGLPVGQQIRRFHFSPVRLKELFEPERTMTVFNETIQQIRASLAEGGFVEIPSGPARGLTYQLPPRSYESKLRIAALNAETSLTQFFVQFDQEVPRRVVLHPEAVINAAETEPSMSLATLNVVQQNMRTPGGTGLEPVPQTTFQNNMPGKDAFHRVPDLFSHGFTVCQPGTAELALPQHVHQVRIFQEPSQPQVAVSIAYRAAKPFSFGETAFLALLDQCGPQSGFQMLANSETKPQNLSGALRWLHNQYLPLIRLLRAHSNDFSKSIESGLVPHSKDPLTADAREHLRAAAENQERAGHHIEAVETWNRLFWQGDKVGQTEAAVAIARCLETLGEEHLSDQYARFALLNSTGAPVGAAAIALLEKQASAAADPEALEQLRAVSFLHCPCELHLAALVEALALNSRDEEALLAGLLLPAGQRPLESMLPAALSRNWWETFDRLVEALPDNQAKAFWRAQKSLAFLNFAEAEAQLVEAGAPGTEMLQALRQGFRIREQITAAQADERFEGLLAWEQWQSPQLVRSAGRPGPPQPVRWEPAPEFAQECPGAELLFNSEQNEFRSCFRIEPASPLKLRFVGPVRLQIEVRPLLEGSFSRPVDDWLELVEYDLTNRVPISQCVPNPALQLAVHSNLLVGLKTVADTEWGPGLHEVEVKLAGRAGLIRVLQATPVLPLRILPPLTIERIHSLVGPGETSPKHALRLALRSPDRPGNQVQVALEDLQRIPVPEQWLAACRWNCRTEFTNWFSLPDAEQAKYRLATSQIREVLDSDTPRDALQRLTTLLEIAELFPDWRAEAQCRAEFLAAQTKCPPGGRRIVHRITQDRVWEPLPISPMNAGLRLLQAPVDLPQDPAVRIRRALLPERGTFPPAAAPERGTSRPAALQVTTNQLTLGAQTVFSASMSLHAPAQVQVEAELARAGFSPLVPMTVALQVDGLEPQQLHLAPLSPVTEWDGFKTRLTTNFGLSEGPHLVRMWIVDPVVNQFVHVGFSGSSVGDDVASRWESLTNRSGGGPGPQSVVWTQSLADATDEKRLFYGATAGQPVRFPWTGPALLRIDQPRDGQTFSHLRLVPRGPQTVVLTPSPGDSESHYRVFVRSTSDTRTNSRPSWSIREPEELSPPRLHLPEPAVSPQPELHDHYHLGGQEDGTWTTGLLFARRRPFELSEQEAAVVNEFAEVNLQYRKANASETVWFDTAALGRVHRPGDLTFGLMEQILGRPATLPFEWGWRGEAFLGTVGPDQNELAGALHTSLEIGQWRPLSRKLGWYPFTGLFAHYLSLSPGQVQEFDYVDQDLYTSYRHDHLWGAVLGSQLEYRPWLDTVLGADVNLVTGEDFGPDHWGMRFSWDQLAGPLRTEVAYRFTHWLNTDDGSDRVLQGISARIYGELWIHGRHRLEIGGQYRYDWPDSGSSYFLVLKWDFSQGRGFKDYGPRQTVFRDLRSRRIAAFNNSFQPGTPDRNRP